MFGSGTAFDDLMLKVSGLAKPEILGLSEEDISSGFQAVYYASIRREEGERVLPHLALLSEQTFEKMARFASLLEFIVPQPLTPESLRKRSLAFNRKTSSFLSTPSEYGPVLRGVVHWGWKGDSQPQQSTRMPIVRFDAEDSGTVVIAYDNVRLGLMRDGIFYPSRPGVFTSPLFKRAVVGSITRLQQSESSALAFMASLHFFVRSAMSHGLGATIIVLNDPFPINLSDCTEAGEEVSFQLRKNEQGRSALGDQSFVLDTEDNQQSVDNLNPARKAYLEFVARLACVDGALILNSRLNPIKYAAKLRTPASSEPVFLGGDIDHQVASVLQGVGTRHSSALGFVAHVRSAVAVTISSDGPVSAFAWLDDRLSWWKNAVEL